MANTFSANFAAASSQSLTAADSASLSFTGNHTVEFWVKMTSQPTAGNYMFLVGKNGNNPQRSWLVFYENAVLGAGVTITSVQYASGADTNYSYERFSYTLTTGTWFHVAIVVTIANSASTKAELFINGVSQGNGTGADNGSGCTAMTDTTSATTLASSQANPSFLDGRMDEVRIWNATRSSAQILANYQYEIDSATNLVGSWHLDNALTDASGNSNTLSNVNTVTFVQDIHNYTATYIETAASTDQASQPIFAPLVLTETVTATDSKTMKYGFGKPTKSSSSWTTTPKS